MNKYIKIICSIALLVCSVTAFSNKENHSYSLVINQGNCISQAVMYEIDSNKNAKIISTAKVSSISAAKYLGYSSSLKFKLGSISIVDLCLEKLAENFYATQKQSDPININSIVIGIASYDSFKDYTSEDNIPLKDHFTNHVLASLKSYKFNYTEDSIILIDDSNLVSISSIQLHKQDVVNSKTEGKHYDNIWTYFHTSLAIAMKSSLNDTVTTESEYIHKVNSGYFQLGIDTAPLFSNIKDESDNGDTQVQKILSSHPLANEIFKEKKCTISYWLQEYLLFLSTKRNNARGLFLADYVLSKYMCSSYIDSKESSLAKLMVSITNLVNKSIDELIKLFEYEKIGKNDCVFIVGDFLMSEFIFNRYQILLNEKITDKSMKKRIILIQYNSLLSGLALAAEHIKSVN